MSQNDIAITELLKRPVAYHAILAKAFRSPTLAIMWSQLYYWSDKTEDAEGWIWKTAQQMFDETGLTRENQDTARKKGIELGVLEDKVAGTPPKIHYRVNVGKTIELMQDYMKDQRKPVAEVAVMTPGDEARRFFSGDETLYKEVQDKIISKVGEQYRETIDHEMRKFVSYWTESTKSGKKQRWQTEKTFEVGRRLGTWLARVAERRRQSRSGEGSRKGIEI